MVSNGTVFTTIVNAQGQPVYTEPGMDEHFEVATSIQQIMTFDYPLGEQNMLELVAMSKRLRASDPNRVEVFPAKITISIEKV